EDLLAPNVASPLATRRMHDILLADRLVVPLRSLELEGLYRVSEKDARRVVDHAGIDLTAKIGRVNDVQEMCQLLRRLVLCRGIRVELPFTFLQFREKGRQSVAVLDVASKESVRVRQEPVERMPSRLRQRLLLSPQRIDQWQPLGLSEGSHGGRKRQLLEERP